MNASRLVLFSFIVLLAGMVLTACELGSSSGDVLQATIEAQQTEFVAFQTQVAAEKATEALKAAKKQPTATGTVAPSPTLPPTETPEPTSKATDTPVPSPTWTDTPPAPTETQVASGSSSSSASSDQSSAAGTPSKGEERIRVENNSGQDFSIKLVCSGGPCQQYSKTSYSHKFPDGLFFFYVYPGRYDITWTICGKTESFVHALNGQWYIHLKKCK